MWTNFNYSNFILHEKSDFLIVFLVGAGLCVIKLVVLIFFDENDKYIYDSIDGLLNENEGDKPIENEEEKNE